MAETMPPASDTAPQARGKRVGAYAKLLANYASDDALIEAGEAAELLFCRGLAFCATSDQDGFITDAQVIRYVGAGMKDALKRADRLAACGPWIRVDGGYIVKSWTKIHETASQKGRRLKADRERKRIKPDSDDTSERNPDGIQTEGVSDSLSLIQSTTEHHSAEQDTESDQTLGGQRPETLHAVPDTTPPNDPKCTKHPNGNPTNENCGGCATIRQRGEHAEARDADKARKAAEEAARNCPRCEGGGKILAANKIPTGRRCWPHLPATASAVS